MVVYGRQHNSILSVAVARASEAKELGLRSKHLGAGLRL